ncbi:hypothetical protein JCM16418A_25990 [Paenibacillus pini]
MKRIKQITDPQHTLCRDDMIWALHYVQKKVAQGEPALLELPKPRLLLNFQNFGEAAIMLFSGSQSSHLENERIRSCLLEAMHGLLSGEDYS